MRTKNILVITATIVLWIAAWETHAQHNYDNQNTLYSLNGDVGIGTTNPSNLQGWDRALDVHAAYHAKLLVTGDHGGVMTGIFSHSTYLGPVGRVGTESNHDLRLTAGYLQDQFTLTTYGNVGIGTTSPEQKLDVRGHLVLDPGTWPVLYTGTGSSELNRYLQLINSPNAASASGLKAGGVLVADSYAYANPGKNDLVVKGHVGIGTADPGTWKLAVDGDIRAKEVVVETGWSDFVFEPDYDLPSLKEVEAHIAQKGHLQDIPSADEVADKGISLGQMDAKLLQKIEELVLYTLAQEKRIEELEKENESIKALSGRLRSLEKFLLKAEEKD